MIDYDYHTSPQDLQAIIDKAGGLEVILTFAQTHHVEVTMGEDLMYSAKIDGGYWGCDLDTFSALVIGIVQYINHNQLSDKLSSSLSH